MKAVAMIPYACADPVKDFNYTGRAIAGDDYKRMLDGEYARHKAAIDCMIDDMTANRPTFAPYVSKLSNKYKRVRTAFFECGVTLSERGGGEMDIDRLIRLWQEERPFLVVLDMEVGPKSDPDLLVDLNMWSCDSAKILDPKYGLTDEEKIAALPEKDFKVKFPDYGSTAYLGGCKLLDKVGKYAFVALADRIVFVRE